MDSPPERRPLAGPIGWRWRPEDGREGPAPAQGGRGARYAVPRARVPREVCETPTLVERLEGYDLKPLSRAKASQPRREHLRQQIELQREIGGEGLWESAGLAFVAEAKAKTIQLRHRTIELLDKLSTCEQSPRDPEPSEFRGTDLDAEQLQAVAEADASESIDEDKAAEPCCGDPHAEQPPADIEADASVGGEEDEAVSKRNSLLAVCLDHRLRTRKVVDLPGVQSIPAPDASKGTTTLHNAPKIISREGWLSSTRNAGSSKAGGRPPPCQSRGPAVPMRSSTGPRQSPQTTRPAQEDNGSPTQPLSPRKQRLKTLTEGFRKRLSKKSSKSSTVRPWESSQKLSSRRAGNLSKYLDIQMLFEDKRVVVVEGKDGKDTNEHVLASIRISENKATGGIRLEVCTTRKQWDVANVVARSMSMDEVHELFVWGKQHQEAAEARYKWLSDLIRMKAEETNSPPPAGDRGDRWEKDVKGMRLVLDGFDSKDDIEKVYPGIELVKSKFAQLFRQTQSQTRAEVDFSLRVGFKNPSKEDLRKDLEIEAARKRYNLYENTSKALYEWYVRLDVSGDGHLDETEFAVFLRGVVHTFNETVDENQVRRHWREMKSFSDCCGFSQFVNYLLVKFPHLTRMTAFEVKRFEEKVRSVTDASVQKSSAQFAPTRSSLQAQPAEYEAASQAD